jgi:hypothetical protein
MDILVQPEKIEGKYVLKLEYWQIEDIRKGLDRVYKQRKIQNEWAEKNRKTDKPKECRSTKPRLIVGDPIEIKEIIKMSPITTVSESTITYKC